MTSSRSPECANRLANCVDFLSRAVQPLSVRLLSNTRLIFEFMRMQKSVSRILSQSGITSVRNIRTVSVVVLALLVVVVAVKLGV